LTPQDGGDQFSSVAQSCPIFCDPWTAACQAPLSISNSRSSLKLESTESVVPSNHLILCHPLLLPSIFPSIRVFSNESVLRIRWPKYWSFSFSISPSNEYSELVYWKSNIYIPKFMTHTYVYTNIYEKSESVSCSIVSSSL